MRDNSHYHLIGIGGIGMSGIAQLLLRRGIKVSGSDLKESKITEDLKALGAEVFIGHNRANLKGADSVVFSSAIKEDNPEIKEAKRLGIPLIKRAKALAELMKDKIVITVTGSHGKTTTASLASCLLLNAGLKPTIALGGVLGNIDTNAYLGEGEFFVAEADESDGSFLYFKPRYSIITNIDYEHLDYYQTFQNLNGTFKKFINNTDKKGCVFTWADDLNLINLLKDYKNKYVLFGLRQNADIYPKNIKLKALNSEFECFFKNKYVDRFSLGLGGLHNILNALAVIALGLELGIDLGTLKKTLIGYKGAGRRIQVKFRDKNFTIIDDYAHHPTEIKATLTAIKTLKANRIIAVFQAHRYSRTKLLIEEFAKSFNLADCIIITDIYPANEAPIEGITGKLVYDKIKEHYPEKGVYFFPKEEIKRHILKNIRPQDLVITLGAGDIGKVCDELVEGLKGKN